MERRGGWDESVVGCARKGGLGCLCQGEPAPVGFSCGSSGGLTRVWGALAFFGGDVRTPKPTRPGDSFPPNHPPSRKAS